MVVFHVDVDLVGGWRLSVRRSESDPSLLVSCALRHGGGEGKVYASVHRRLWKISLSVSRTGNENT